MKLTNTVGDSFEMSIVGYQYPDLKPTNPRGYDYDANWLTVRIDATMGQRHWSRDADCLLTSELAKLMDWVSSLFSSENTEQELEFVEPSLTFGFGGIDDYRAIIRVYFGLGGRPGPLNDPDIAFDKSLFAEFRLTREDANAWTDSLRAELAKYPPR